MRYSRAEYTKMLAAQHEVARAEEDYNRLRAAYVEIARTEPGHEVALAMVGCDMDRAHAHLQALIGLPQMPFAHDPGRAAPGEADERPDEKEKAPA